MPTPSLLLIHGPASGAWMWAAWRKHLQALGWQVNVLDLRGHGRSMPTDLSAVTLEDYVADVASVTVQIEAAQGIHPIMGGWDMGALVAMMYASGHSRPPAQLFFAPTPPVEVGGRAPIEAVRQASGQVLGPEAFGVFPGNRERSRASLPDLTDEELDWLVDQSRDVEESGIAFRQALRGVSIAPGSIQSPTLVVYGEAETEEQQSHSRELAAYFGGESMGVPRAGHWGIVCHDEAVAEAAPRVDGWLQSRL